MLARPPSIIPDPLSPTRSHLLDLALADYLPASAKQPQGDHGDAAAPLMPPGHHLVYFPPMQTESQLLPDGTDPKHSPGLGFSRRLWAGGSIETPPPAAAASSTQGLGEVAAAAGLRMAGPNRFCACRERIADVTVRGTPGAEKVYVELLREYGVYDGQAVVAPLPTAESLDLDVKVTERRTLVFLRDQEVGDGKAATAAAAATTRRAVKPPHKPDYSFDLTPSRRLLFHFSALSHNAHLIHLDSEYCRSHEGHRELLVHGPLSLVLMMTAVQDAARTILSLGDLGPRPWVQGIRYRNLAPLYVGERMRVCVRHTPNAAVANHHTIINTLSPVNNWDVWIEGPDGGMVVKASAVTCNSL